MAGRTRNQDVAAAGTLEVTGAEQIIAAPKRVRRRRTTPKTHAATVGAASGPTPPYTGGGASSVNAEMTYAGEWAKGIVGFNGLGMQKAAIARNFGQLLDTILG